MRSAVLVLILWVAFVIGGLFASRRPVFIKSGAIKLQNTHLAWFKDGAPEKVQLERYNLGGISVHTNTYHLNGRDYESLFIYDHTYFTGKGILFVTRNGEVIWLDNKKGAKVVRPPRNE